MERNEVIYQTIQVVSVDAIKSELDKLREEIAELRAALQRKPNETPLSDKDAAKRLKKSVSTLWRVKLDGRIGSVETAHGRLIRVCDIEEYFRS